MGATKVHSNWHHPRKDFETSTQQFYAAVEQALLLWKIPGLQLSRIEYKEGGAFSARREYLRVQREKYVFDICAAPFGTGYFFSWWFAETGPKWGFLKLCGIFFAAALVFGIVFKVFTALLGDAGVFLAFPCGVIAWVVILWFVAQAIHNGTFGPDAEEAVLNIPVIGWCYAKLVGPFTYYKVDTQLMFQSAVHTAVLEVVESVLAAKGARALTEGERKPTMNDFFKK